MHYILDILAQCKFSKYSTNNLKTLIFPGGSLIEYTVSIVDIIILKCELY